MSHQQQQHKQHEHPLSDVQPEDLSETLENPQRALVFVDLTKGYTKEMYVSLHMYYGRKTPLYVMP